MRINYEFGCEKCGSHLLIQHSTNIILDERIHITDYGNGPEIEIVDEGYYGGSGRYSTLICGECGWELPVNSDDDLIDYIIGKYSEGDEENENN